jgi:tripartite-type tricarboxylate transporter receptor subunit TctC
MRCLLSLLFCLLAPLSAAHAQTTDFPSRPVTFVIPLGAGGSMDIIARAIAPKFEMRLGKPAVIENRTGGGTVIAANTVAKAAPDGHTLLFAPSGTLTTNAALYKALSYDPVKDFVPVALYVKVPFVLVINNDVPAKSVAELVTLSKQRPLSFGSTGTGAVPHLAGELFKAKTGIVMTHVPYKGSQAALSDTMAGHVQITFADPALAPQLIKEGKVRALGVTSLTRVGVVPDVPPLADVGVPGYEAVSWHMIMAPAGTPPAVVTKLRETFRAIFSEADIRDKLVQMGLVPVDTPDESELRAFIAREMKNWGSAVQQAGLAGSE